MENRILDIENRQWNLEKRRLNIGNDNLFRKLDNELF